MRRTSVHAINAALLGAIFFALTTSACAAPTFVNYGLSSEAAASVVGGVPADQVDSKNGASIPAGSVATSASASSVFDADSMNSNATGSAMFSDSAHGTATFSSAWAGQANSMSVTSHNELDVKFIANENGILSVNYDLLATGTGYYAIFGMNGYTFSLYDQTSYAIQNTSVYFDPWVACPPCREFKTSDSTTGTWITSLVAGDTYQLSIQLSGGLGGGYASSSANMVGNLDWAITSATPAVPEPETYAMMLVGLGLLGFFARRGQHIAA